MSHAITSWETPAREFAKGIGEAVAARTVSRKKGDGSIENWADVAYRVSVGNAMLHEADSAFEFEALHKHMRQASILLSGRHLQHGDATQPTRNQEVFTNCSTAASTFILFYLLLNGSGVGRSYDDDMMVVDWSKNMPHVIPVIRADHADVASGEIGDNFVNPKWPSDDELVRMGAEVFEVPDSREGWAKAIEKIEYMTWTGLYADKVLILDFSHVRPRGSPIGGMQNRPASGPGPIMAAIKAIAGLKGSGMDPWEATLTADHYAAECVLVGGARRAARMSTKTWRDPSVFAFIKCKTKGGLWSSNNSVTVDEEFWRHVVNAKNGVHSHDPHQDDEQAHAFAVFQALCKVSYATGEPGLINVDRLVKNSEGIEALLDGDYAESERFKLDDETKQMTAAIAKVFANKEYTQITNPCGEISLGMLGGYCVIADVVPYHAGGYPTVGNGRTGAEARANHKIAWDDNVEEALRVATRALIRVNLMDCLYGKEVKRTNRIGVGMTGLHEYAWQRFGYGWADLIDEEKSKDFWATLSRFSNAVVDEARTYSAKIGVNEPHTSITMKPAGTTSKLFGLTEGAHLPSMREFIRWVQFRYDDPLIEAYRAKGYPVQTLKTYGGTVIVGFPTVPEICNLGMGDKLVTAGEATPEEQYQWLRLLEKHWIDGCEEDANHPDEFDLGHGRGNQVSYTLKLDPKLVSFEDFCRTLLEGQSTIKCCAVMPLGDTSGYEYLPESPVTPDEFRSIVEGIHVDKMEEDIGMEHVDCSSGACPIDFGAAKVA